MEKTIQNENAVVNCLCELFGINPERVEIKSYSDPDNPNTQRIDCNVVEKTKGLDKILVNTTLKPSIETVENDNTKQISQSEKIQRAKQIIEDLKNEYRNNEKIEAVGNSIGSAVNILGGFVNGVLSGVLEKLEEMKSNDDEELTDEDFDTDESDEDFDTDESDEEPEDTENKKTEIDANYIKNRLREKFETVINAEKAKKRQLYEEKFVSALVVKITSIIENEEYQSLTNDLESEDAGIGFELTKTNISNIQTQVSNKIGVIYEELLGTEFVLNCLRNVLDDFAVELNFADSDVSINSGSSYICKLFFN